jgi:hypothetical protein
MMSARSTIWPPTRSPGFDGGAIDHPDEAMSYYALWVL